ncbi:MAG: hypothetical protein Q4P15_09120 [Propionibacteriaceae bacterium]|nr:hypothetical protein [Propionibacteriaceae bacterium]
MRTTRIRPARRVTDVVGDVVLVAWVVVWFTLSRSLRGVLDAIAQPLERLGSSTGTMADRIDETGRSLGDVPLLGEQMAAPFPQMASSMQDLANQLATQGQSLGSTSAWLVPLVFLIPTVIAGGLYIPWRIRRVQESTAARALLAGNPRLDLFALRAMSTAHLPGVMRVSADPVAAWLAGDPSIIQGLSALELRRVGVEIVVPEGASLTRAEH